MQKNGLAQNLDSDLAPTTFQNATNICETIVLMRSLIARKKINIAFLGYTDVMVDPESWQKLDVNQKTLKNRENAENLIKIHGRRDVHVVPTLTSALRAIIGKQFDLTVFDFTKYEGSEVEWDFNFPIPDKFRNKFDLVIDAGTCEHIFNISQALSNVHLMLRKDGIAYHGGPLCWPNHGFYGYNPTLFADFYEANQCEILEMFLTANFLSQDGKRNRLTALVPKYERFRMSDLLKNHSELLKLEYNLCTAIKKTKTCEQIVFPIQHKYRKKENWM